MVDLISIVKYCDERLRIGEIRDFPGSFNGLQIDKVGKVSKIGAAVDAGLIPLKKRQRIRSISWSFIMEFFGLHLLLLPG